MNNKNPLDPIEIHSNFWNETASEENPFAADQCLCSGYDVYNDVLPNASWIEYLFLLIKKEQPTKTQAALLNVLSIAIANPGPRDNSVQAAMSGAAGGSTFASSLMAAIAVGAGNLGGAREVVQSMELWETCGTNLSKWQDCLLPSLQSQKKGIWLDQEHPPGFDPHGVSCPQPIRQSLEVLSQLSTKSEQNRESQKEKMLPWLHKNRTELEAISGNPLAFSGLAAAAFIDISFEKCEAEMLYLLLRLPGAAAHALEQHELGWKSYPFFSDRIDFEDEQEGVESHEK